MQLLQQQLLKGGGEKGGCGGWELSNYRILFAASETKQLLGSRAGIAAGTPQLCSHCGEEGSGMEGGESGGSSELQP